jgi:hypothetical protein
MQPQRADNARVPQCAASWFGRQHHARIALNALSPRLSPELESEQERRLFTRHSDKIHHGVQFAQGSREVVRQSVEQPDHDLLACLHV